MPSSPASTEADLEDDGRAGPAARRRDQLPSYVFVLSTVLLTFVIAGVSATGRWQQAILTILMGLALVTALRIAAARRVWQLLAETASVVLSLFAVTAAVLGTVDPRATRAAACALVFFAPPALLVGIVRRIRRTRSVTVESVVGVLSVYLLMGLFYTFLYGALDRLGGTPFFTGGNTATPSHCLYFSFITLTTVGYGDFTAASNVGHTLSVSEALIGQVYLVTVVSLIVGNLGRRR